MADACAAGVELALGGRAAIRREPASGTLPELCQNLGQGGVTGSKPEQADPLKSPQFAGMRPVGGLRGGLRGSAILRLEVRDQLNS